MEISLQTKEFQILDKKILVHFTDENVAEEYFDFSQLESEWHTREVGQYHFSMLLGCLRAYYFFFKYDRELSLKEKGTYLMGKIIHKEIQTYLEKKYGFVIIEFPLEDEVEDDITILGKIDITDTKKKKTDDIKSTRYMPIINDLTEEKFEEKFGKAILQVLAYAFFLNNSYFSIDPIKQIGLIYVDKADLYTKPIIIDYDKELGKYFYLKIRARAKYLHDHVLQNEVPDEIDLRKTCQYCSFLDLCPEGTEYVASISVPVIFERNEYEKTYEGKRAYWKYDYDNKKWIKTKGFVEFLKKELNYTNEQIEALP